MSQTLNTDGLRFASLGSGSEGNATVIEAHANHRTTRILLDCGFSSKELDKRLAVIGLLATDLDAILITHEHHDHAAGAYRTAKRWRLPLYATHGTMRGAYDAISPEWIDYHALNLVWPDAGFMIGELSIHPIPVPHDAREPVQYRFSAAQRKLAVLTDVGSISPHMKSAFDGQHALILECNHDLEMLQQSSYPASLKARISGDWGHLSNCQAALFLQQLDRSSLSKLWCAHLSQSNNTPALARTALAGIMGWADDQVHVLDQSPLGQWWVV